MKLFRKYYSEEQLQTLYETQPGWGVDMLHVGHYIHEPKANYPDLQHPDPYYFNWEKGRVLNEFQLVYVSNGQGVFEADGVPQTRVEAGTAFLLFPGVWHRYRPAENTGWEEFWVGYKGHYAEYLMKQKCFKTSAPFVHIGFSAELLNVFIQLIETVKYESAAYYQLSSCLVTQLLALVYSSAIIHDTQQQHKNNLIHVARFRIHENLHQNMNVELLARELNVSYTWLRRAFKETIGVSPGQYHLNMRVEKACKYLKETGLTITEIAYDLGFTSEFYFSRIFKKKMGMSPKQYRSHNLVA